MTIDIRMATAADADALWQLIYDLAAYQGHPDAVKLTASQLREQLELERPPFECLVAETNGSLVAFALFFQSYSTWEGKAGLYLEDLYVCPKVRGAGVGRLLIAALAKLGASRGCGRIDWTVLRSNLSAVDFYDKLGAQNLSDWSHYRLPILQSA